jgi:hypothetical protein
MLRSRKHAARRKHTFQFGKTVTGVLYPTLYRGEYFSFGHLIVTPRLTSAGRMSKLPGCNASLHFKKSQLDVVSVKRTTRANEGKVLTAALLDWFTKLQTERLRVSGFDPGPKQDTYLSAMVLQSHIPGTSKCPLNFNGFCDYTQR